MDNLRPVKLYVRYDYSFNPTGNFELKFKKGQEINALFHGWAHEADDDGSSVNGIIEFVDGEYKGHVMLWEISLIKFKDTEAKSNG